ncbi:hypothetical protein NQZ79_g3433 [Umbelopsis isabellina]|nr:hypothetical protein NQZ79_g3433 [Umbelopsis isabellina]
MLAECSLKMVLDNLKKSYSGQILVEDSSDHVLSRQESDDTLASSTRNSPRQRLDKGKQVADVHAFFKSYSYHCFSLESLSAGVSSSNAGTETGVRAPSISTIYNGQMGTSGPSMAAVMSRNRKRNEALVSTSMVMHMPQSQLIKVGLVRAKKKAKCPTASINPNLNRTTSYLPKESKMVAEAARSLEAEWSFLLSSNQLKYQPLATSSSINWNHFEQLGSAANISGTPSLSMGHNLAGNASTSQVIPTEIQEAKFISAKGTNSQSLDQNTLYLESYVGDLKGNVKISEGHNPLVSYDMSTFTMNQMNQAHQLSYGPTSNFFSPIQFKNLVSPTNRKANSSHDNVPFDQEDLERLSLGYDSVVASQIDQQPEFATAQPLQQNTPIDAVLLAYENTQKTSRMWPSKSKHFAVQFSDEDPNQKVTQTEQLLSNLTQGSPQSMLLKQTTSRPIYCHFNDNITTSSLGSIESFSDLTDPASEENYIPSDIMYDGANWRSDPTLEQNPLKFPGDLYTPTWIKIKDGKRWGLCRYCFKEDENQWFKMKCSSYRYHMNTHHGICSNGKYFAQPLDRRVLPDGSVDFYCHECNRYKHVQRHPQDDIIKWWRHAAEVESLNDNDHELNETLDPFQLCKAQTRSGLNHEGEVSAVSSMKQRFSALDVRATVANLKERLIGLRVQNIYDVTSKTLLFKFSKPDSKELVLIESGIRLHTTQFARDKSAMPSHFCGKLRKHLRTRRLVNVRQLGSDRIVDFEFAGGELHAGYHIIVEFYASGNIILTDQDYHILTLLRVVQPNENVKMAIGEIYDTKTIARDFQSVQLEKLQNVLKSAGPKDVLKKVINTNFDYGPSLSEHAILRAQLDPNLKVATDMDTSDGSPKMQSLFSALEEADKLIEAVGTTVPKGYIILKDTDRKNEDGSDFELYDEFHPHLYEQHKTKKFKEFDTFDAAVDLFFSEIESQKLDMKVKTQEENSAKKLEAVKREQMNRIQGLENLQMTNVRKAQLIELNLQMVDAAIMIIRNAIATGMDWRELEDLVKNEQKHGNAIALMIDSLKLESNEISLRLADPEFEDSDDSSNDSDSDEDEPTSGQKKNAKELSKVDVDIYLTAFANARKYYDQKKATAAKHEKTIAASTKAMKSAEKKIKQELKENKITATVSKIRKPFWFEKFLWFISTESYLVIAGRDMQQNELLVKRYLGKDDIYVHADLHGAASVIIKNSNPGHEIPPTTLHQAGIMSVCQSKAWEAKIVTSAYWVNPDQVSKSAPTGEYLTTGSFMIRGKKNYLPPVQLVYGFGYLFKLDDSSLGNHVKERRYVATDDSDVQNTESEDVPRSATPPVEETPQSTDADKDGDGIEELNASADSVDEQASEQASNEDSEDDSQTPDQTTSQDQSQSDDSSDEDDEEMAFPDTQVAQSTGENTYDKYNLESLGGEDSDNDLDSGSQQATGARKSYITAKQRRMLKKGKTLDDIEVASADEKPASKPSNKKSNKENEPPKPLTPSRGKKGKSKKIKEKYADQDEEERELRMELLAVSIEIFHMSNKGPQPKGKKAKRDAQTKAESLSRQLAKDKAKKEFERKRAESSQVERGHQENAAQQSEEIKQMLKEENINVLEADEMANLSVLDSLTAQPIPEDMLHFAIPVCAPYTALLKYKYKVKLVPGAMKKGKGKVTSTFEHGLRYPILNVVSPVNSREAVRNIIPQPYGRNTA